MTEESFGARVRSRRKKLWMTQQEVADCIGLSRSSLANIESGRQVLPSSTLPVLCRTLHVSADWLLGLDLSSEPLIPELLVTARAAGYAEAVAHLRRAFDAAAASPAFTRIREDAP